MIFNGKENIEASAICFEIRIPKKKNEELLRKVLSKIYEVILFWKKTKKKTLFVNISEYHHRTMGLKSCCSSRKKERNERTQYVTECPINEDRSGTRVYTCVCHAGLATGVASFP